MICFTVLTAANDIEYALRDASAILPEDILRQPQLPDTKVSYGEQSFDTQWRKWQADPEVYRPPPKPEG
jgi:hypothetical protein